MKIKSFHLTQKFLFHLNVTSSSHVIVNFKKNIYYNTKNMNIKDKVDFIKFLTENNLDRVIKDDKWMAVDHITSKEDYIFELNEKINAYIDYLSSTDYMVVKCIERGLDMQSEYPLDYQKRQDARDRINEIRKEIESL